MLLLADSPGVTRAGWRRALVYSAKVYLGVFPTALLLYAPYTESLFLALAVGCLYAARRSAWLLAGGLGALAALTRSTVGQRHGAARHRRVPAVLGALRQELAAAARCGCGRRTPCSSGPRCCSR